MIYIYIYIYMIYSVLPLTQLIAVSFVTRTAGVPGV